MRPSSSAPPKRALSERHNPGRGRILPDRHAEVPAMDGEPRNLLVRALRGVEPIHVHHAPADTANSHRCPRVHPGRPRPARGGSLFHRCCPDLLRAGQTFCLESEWQFACEGESMAPVPLWVRPRSRSMQLQADIYLPSGDLRDLREASGAHPACKSPFGAMDMVGNVDEWTVREDKGAAHRSALRGGWWMPGRNRCRAATTAHDEVYKGPQTGFRCCAWPG